MKRATLRIPRDQLEQIRTMLGTLPAKPRTQFGAQDLVLELQQEIRHAIEQGYTLRDIAALINDQDVPISASTLATALRKSRAMERAAKNPDAPLAAKPAGRASAQIGRAGSAPSAAAPLARPEPR